MTLFLRRGLLGALAVAALLLAGPASAHHLMGFFHLEPTPLSGLISGMMHPILGPDHLLFLLAIGLVGLHRPRAWVVALLACGLVGAGLGLVVPGVAAVEPLVALSLVCTGLVLAGKLPAAVLIPSVALHGYALSGSVIGWEPTPIACYLIGLLISQAALLTLGLTLVQRWGQQLSNSARSTLTGLLIGIGLAFTWTAVIP
jgi:urease accessory protein